MYNDFEKVFGDFIDGTEYDKSEEAFIELLFNTARASFKAGWLAAGGEAPKTVDGLTYTRPSRVIPLDNSEGK